ncbi:SMODS domain-containing nucleotidyltransferase [Cysteiniphilum litorale]|uniref:nucleotidyltransferase domain-containing protein n=1 Tax=Cysteiniphilum litorale TaxID=2056700 RepID=UPI003F882056
MSKVDKFLDDLYKNIRLGYKDHETLKNKRDLLLNEIKKDINESSYKLIDAFHQGSYALRTGVTPVDSESYDIDVGLVFDNLEETLPKEIKSTLFDILNKRPTRTVVYKTPCITVDYNDGYHIDFTVYKKSGDNYYLAYGKGGDSEHNWKESSPKALLELIKEYSDNNELFRKAIRLIKYWKKVHYVNDSGKTKSGDPASIGITLIVKDYFSNKNIDPKSTISEVLKDILSYINNCDLMNYLSPVKDYSQIFYKLTAEQIINFKEKVQSFYDALNLAIENQDIKILQKLYKREDITIKDNADFYITSGMNA